jgi:hypothetical protein
MPAGIDVQSLAERIAGGSEVALTSNVAAQALSEGLSGVLLYGAAGVGGLALTSYVLFNVKRKTLKTCPDEVNAP